MQKGDIVKLNQPLGLSSVRTGDIGTIVEIHEATFHYDAYAAVKFEINDRTLSVHLCKLNLVTCQWFVRCKNVAVSMIEHPALGKVPTCASCVALLNLKEDR